MAESRLSDFKNLFRERPAWHWKEVSDRLGVSRQSVYRLRDELYSKENIALEATIRDDDGKLLTSDKVGVGYLKWPEATPIEDDVSLTLSKLELEALKTAVAQMAHLTPLLESALGKLTENNVVQKLLQADPIIFNPQVDDYAPGLFGRVSKAIRDRRVAEIRYQNAKKETKTYKFNSYVLVSSDQHLHLIGVSHNSLEAGFDTVIRLRLDQVLDFKLLREYFKRPDFNVSEYARRHFGPFHGEGEPVTIRVRFAPEKAQYVRRTRRHPTQKIEDQEDGGVIWRIEAPLTDGLVHWLASYGPHARVLGPLELKDRVLKWALGAVDANS